MYTATVYHFTTTPHPLHTHTADPAHLWPLTALCLRYAGGPR